MAPHMHRDYPSTGDPSRYSLRTLKHGENNFLQSRDLDVSKVAGKEDFFRCIGLQMKRFQYGYKMPTGSSVVKNINIPSGMILRDCRVVILGRRCELCRLYFKCETDLNVHHVLKHCTNTEINNRTVVKETQCSENEINVYKEIAKPLDHTTIESNKNFDTKLNKKLRLTLKIGEEIMARVSVKRKYLRGNKRDTCTQTEPNRASELIIDNDEHESSTLHIDSLVFDNSSRQCCNSSLQVVNSPNRYSASNIVASEQSLSKENIPQEESHISNQSLKSRATSISTNCSAVSKLVDSYLIHADQGNLLKQNDTEHNNNSKEICSVHSNNSLTTSKRCYSSRFTEISQKGISDYSQTSRSLAESPNSSLEVQFVSEDSEENGRDIKEIEIQEKLNTNEKEKSTPDNGISNMVQVIVPVILPIIMSNKNVPNSPLQLTINSTPPQKNQQQQMQQQQGQQQNKQQQQGQQQNKQRNQQQTIKNSTHSVENSSDNEIEEVLRIVRKSSTSSDINHESPTRFEQKMLIQDAIRDMKRMEEQGWHLLEKGTTTESLRKRRRSIKTNNKNRDQNECVKKKKQITVESNSYCNAVRNPTEERYFSSTKEHVAKIQNYSGTVTVCAADNVKENLLTCNKNIYIPVEVLRQYGINYDNEVLETNDNTRSIQEIVSRFLVPCSGAMENRSNRPVVIDLVNDTDE